MNGVSERSYMMQLSSPVSPSKTSFTGSSFQSNTQLSDKGYARNEYLILHEVKPRVHIMPGCGVM